MTPFRLTCAACGHADDVPDDPAQSVYTCSECRARTAFGVLMARVTHLPHSDRRFVVAQFEHGQGEKRVEVSFAFDREYGAEIALDLLSVCDPGRHRALVAATAGARDVPGAPRREDAVSDLDGAVLCMCGAPSAFKNGACSDCIGRALA